MHVQALEPRCVADHPLRYATEPPDDQPAGADREYGDGGRNQYGNHLWHQCL